MQPLLIEYNRVSPQVKFVSCLSANLLVFLFFCPHRFASCSLIQTCVPTFPNLSAGFFARTRFLRQRRRSATIHNIISASTDQHLEPLPTQLPPRPQPCLSVVAAATHDSPPPPPPPRRHHDHRYHDANSTSTPGTPTLPPLPVNAGGRPSTGTRGGGGYISCRCRPSSYALPPIQEEGGGKPHVNRHRRPSNVIISQPTIFLRLSR